MYLTASHAHPPVTDMNDGKGSGFKSHKKYIGVEGNHVLASGLSDGSDRGRKLRCCD